MRIDLSHGPQQTPESNRSNAHNSTAAGSSSTSAGHALGEDQAQLSGAHAQVAALAAQAAQLPEVRQERVHALRQAIQGGHYHPSPEQVAGAMFAHVMTEPAA